MEEFFTKVEETQLSRFREAGLVQHKGDRGANREAILRDYLSTNLPQRFGVIKGEMITRDGRRSHAADVIVYDKLSCPVFYSNETAVLPIEGVYGIIEVKSTLTKAEFVDASRKIQAFKDLAPTEPTVVRTREYVTVQPPSRPFGIVFGYQLGDNSLDSLLQNWIQLNDEIHFVASFVNLIVALGAGVLYYEGVNFRQGERSLLLDTDEFCQFIELGHKRVRTGEDQLGDMLVRPLKRDLGSRTFGRFFVLLLIMLERMKLGVPDLARYLDPTLPATIHRES